MDLTGFAVDIPEDMSLCRSIGTKGDCLGDGLREARKLPADLIRRGHNY